jgi:hypothetical protein
MKRAISNGIKEDLVHLIQQQKHETALRGDPKIRNNNAIS